MSITQLRPPLPLLTPLGEAWAHFIWSDGLETNVHFGVFQRETGENWWWPNHQVRLCPNISNEHPSTSPIQFVPGLDEHRKRHPLAPKNKERDRVSR